MKKDRSERLCRDYTATVLGMIGKILGGDGWKLDSYMKIAYPEYCKEDTRTAKQIADDIVKRLTK